MVGVRASVVAWGSDEFTEVAGLAFRDAAGREHRVSEKLVVVAPELTYGSPLPIEVLLDADVTGMNESHVAITLAYSMVTDDGLSQLIVSPSDVVFR